MGQDLSLTPVNIEETPRLHPTGRLTYPRVSCRHNGHLQAKSCHGFRGTMTPGLVARRSFCIGQQSVI